jgi:hypothetical protein
VIDHAIAFPDTHLYVAFELIKIFFRIDQVKIVSRVGTFDDHHKKIAAVIKIPVAYWWLEFVGVFFNPLLQVYWRLHFGHRHHRIWRARSVKHTPAGVESGNGSAPLLVSEGATESFRSLTSACRFAD